MNLSDLAEQARKIIRLAESVSEGGFEPTSFSTGSGGIPSNRLNIPVIREHEDFRYDTVANGKAYSGEIVVLAKKTGIRDADDLEIYLTPCGKTFVFFYMGGSPASFDRGYLQSPNMK